MISALPVSMHSNGHTIFASLERRSHPWFAEEEDAIICQLHKIRISKNDYLPVNRLPNELLLEVFAFVQLKAFPSSRWVIITHVCFRWRATALASQKLWSRIGPWSSSMISACLQRAKDMSLYIHFMQATATESFRVDAAKISDILQPHAHRIVEVKVSVCTKSLRTLSSTGFFTQSWDNLQALSLTRNRGSSWGWGWIGAVDFRAVLRSPPPYLRHLSLDGLIIECWHVPSRPMGLRTLILKNVRDEESGPSMGTFLKILQSCSNTLEDLLLDAAGPSSEYRSDSDTDTSGNTGPSRSYPLVSLNKIRRIVLKDVDHSQIPLLLAHLILPDSTCLQISSDDEEPRSVESWLPSDRAGLKMLAKMDRVTIRHSPGQLDIITYSKNGDNRRSQFQVCQTYCEPWDHSVLQVLGSVFKAYPVNSVDFVFRAVEEELSVITGNDWHSALETFPQVKSLWFVISPEGVDEEDAEYVKMFLRALHPEPLESDHSESPTMLPSLTTLSFLLPVKIVTETNEKLRQCISVRKRMGSSSVPPYDFTCIINDQKY